MDTYALTSKYKYFGICSPLNKSRSFFFSRALPDSSCKFSTGWHQHFNSHLKSKPKQFHKCHLKRFHKFQFWLFANSIRVGQLLNIERLCLGYEMNQIKPIIICLPLILVFRAIQFTINFAMTKKYHLKFKNFSVPRNFFMSIDVNLVFFTNLSLKLCIKFTMLNFKIIKVWLFSLNCYQTNSNAKPEKTSDCWKESDPRLSWLATEHQDRVRIEEDLKRRKKNSRKLFIS